MKVSANFLKMAAVLGVIGAGIYGMSRIKQEQQYLAGPVGPVWKYGTSDPALQQAIETGEKEEIKSILQRVPITALRPNPLTFLAHDRTINALIAFIEAGWHPNGVDKKGIPVLKAIEGEEPLALRTLLEHGATTAAADQAGATAIQLAAVAQNKSAELCKALLDYGADPNLPPRRRTNMRYLPAPLPAALYQGNDEAVPVLLGRKARAAGLPICGSPEFMRAHRPNWARDAERMTKLLLDHGADPNEIGGGTLSFDPAKWKYMQGTALLFHAAHGNIGCVKLLLEHGADPSIKSNTGKTALEVAKPECRQLLLAAKRK